MGTGRFDPNTYASYTSANFGSSDRATLRSASTASMFKSRTIDPSLDPKLAKDLRRESRDSDDNPAATPIMLFTDVTGSMGRTSQEVLTGMEVITQSLYDRKPVTDPHILTGAIGDLTCDRHPFQMSEFEADIRIMDATRKLYIEGGGGANDGESYATAWLAAAMMTSTDAWDKRREKGFLFTIGDEPVLGSVNRNKIRGGLAEAINPAQAKHFLGLDLQAPMSADDIYALAKDRWEIFHICVNQNYREAVEQSFGDILGDRLIWMQDIAHLPELIVSAIQVTKGADKGVVASSWGGDTSVAIAKALGGLPSVGGGSTGGVARL